MVLLWNRAQANILRLEVNLDQVLRHRVQNLDVTSA
jgi:hypothetical protein